MQVVVMNNEETKSMTTKHKEKHLEYSNTQG